MPVTRGISLGRVIGEAVAADLKDGDYAELDWVATKSDLRKRLLDLLREGESEAVEEALYKYLRANLDVSEFLRAVDFDGLWRMLEEDEDEEDDEELDEDE